MSIKRRIRRAIERPGQERRSSRDRARLLATTPHLAERLIEEHRSQMKRLSEPYAIYVETVSSPRAAASLETAALLANLCRILEPKRVLDLGSGFSTFVLCSTAHGAEICSIDDSPSWLDATRRFLTSQGQEPALLGGLDDLRRLTGAFDLVFHDMGNLATRREWVAPACRMVGPGGWALLDDAHKRQYRPTLDRLTSHVGGSLYDMRWLTLDQYGRWSALWCHHPGVAQSGVGEQPFNAG